MKTNKARPEPCYGPLLLGPGPTHMAITARSQNERVTSLVFMKIVWGCPELTDTPLPSLGLGPPLPNCE